MDEVMTEKPGQQMKQEATQVRNDAGGFGWQVTDLERLKRFLVLGSESGTYYANKQELGLQNVKTLIRLIKTGHGLEAVEIIRDFSMKGRCAKRDTIVYSLAMCAKYHEGKGSNEFLNIHQAAYKALSEICCISTDLFHFVKFCEEICKNLNEKTTGWGRAHRKAIGKWYCDKTGRDLAYQVTKYKQRDGWSHHDLLRLCHAKPQDSKPHQAVFKFIAKGYDKMMEHVKSFGEVADDDLETTISYLQATEQVLKASHEDVVVDILRKNDLVREHIPTVFLSSKKVWNQLLIKMPMTAMIRNLGKMSTLGLFDDGGEMLQHVVKCLKNEDLLKKARIHPFNVLVALQVYERGKGVKGSNTWNVRKEIVQALDAAFYMSFKFVEPTGKRYMLGIDVSGSMGTPCLGSDIITAAMASAAMAMVTMKTEESVHSMGFSRKFVNLDIDKSMKLNKVMEKINSVTMGATDCAQPMIYARQRRIPVDVFIVYTDCETWIGKEHPYKALQKYRKAMDVPDAKLIVCAMTSTGFTIADPSDRGMLDMAGFDSAAPEIIRQFSLGLI
eukprot:gene16073-17696_t